MRRWGAGLAVLACCVAFGCGGDDDDGGSSGGGGSSEESAIRAELRSFAEAVAANDPKAACEHLTESAQEKAADTIPGASSCESAHRTAFNAVDAKAREGIVDQFEEAKFKIEVDGDTAELQTLDGRSGPLKMKKVAGVWKVDQNTVFFNRNE